MKPKDALRTLVEGNRRFASGSLKPKNLSPSKRLELLKGQRPFAIVLACSDSRVSPDILFDAGPGELFAIRVAGNVVDDIALGSMEFAAKYLNASLLVILGHQFCGAVEAALDAQGAGEGNIGAILKKIVPAVKTAKAAGEKDRAILVDSAVKENIKNVYGEIMDRSPILRGLAEEGALKIVTAKFHLESGEVEILGQ